MTAHSFTNRLQIVAAIGLSCASLARPVVAQPMDCPMPQAVRGHGVLRETPRQIAETGRFLASGDNVNRAPEVVVDLRKRYPGVSDAEIENYLVAAYCPVAAKLDGLSLTEQRGRVERFAHEASVAVYGK